jgi:hypothetical protein
MNEDTETPQGDGEGREQETALLPKSIFGQKDVTPGSECKFRVVHVYNDEVEVEYVAHDEKKKTDSYSEVDDKIDAMGGGEMM